MFRKMRRFKQELPVEDTIKVFESGSFGTLAVSGDDGYPYAVPLNYVYADGKLYFHCAKQGHKLDALQSNSKASFCVVSQDKVVPEKLTTLFESAIAFGRASILGDEDKRKVLELFSQKYFSSNSDEKNEEEIQRHWNTVCLVALEIEHMSGKAQMDIINGRK